MMRQVILTLLCLGLVGAMRKLRGGISETKVEESHEAVQFAVQAINDMYTSQGDTRPRQLERVIRARQQVVAGQKLYLALSLTGGDGPEYCYVDVVFASWYRKKDPNGRRLEVVRGPECRTYMPGGEYPLDGIEGEALNALDFAVREYNRRSNSANVFKLGVEPSSLDATGQVVAGFIYKFKDAMLVETECEKEDVANIDLESCQPKESGQASQCDLEVVVTWRSLRYSLRDMDCTPSPG